MKNIRNLKEVLGKDSRFQFEKLMKNLRKINKSFDLFKNYL